MTGDDLVTRAQAWAKENGFPPITVLTVETRDGTARINLDGADRRWWRRLLRWL